jgi:hypothetical protein
MELVARVRELEEKVQVRTVDAWMPRAHAKELAR